MYWLDWAPACIKLAWSLPWPGLRQGMLKKLELHAWYISDKLPSQQNLNPACLSSPDTFNSVSSDWGSEGLRVWWYKKALSWFPLTGSNWSHCDPQWNVAGRSITWTNWLSIGFCRVMRDKRLSQLIISSYQTLRSCCIVVILFHSDRLHPPSPLRS